MWFKHLHLYRLHGAPELDSQTLANALDEHAAKPLGNADARRLGWTAPAGRLGGDQRLHEIQGHRLLSALRQERLLPASVVKEEVDGDVIPFGIAVGNRASLTGINVIGMGRRGFSDESISRLRSLYRELFRGSGVFRDRLEAMRLSYDNSAEAAQIFAFLDEAGRNGICQAAQRSSASRQGN